MSEYISEMTTSRGHRIRFLCPEMIPIDPLDLKTHTRNICRYSGAVDWRLIRHLALCTDLVREKLKTGEQGISIIDAGYCAAHDLHESYVNDMVSGLKKHARNYASIENRWEVYVHKQIGLPLHKANASFVKQIDLRALVIEMTCLNHPAAELVQEMFGGVPTEQELKSMEYIQSISLTDCWHIVWGAVLQARRELRK